jgi:trehalose 6-phosphate phosphatase
MIDVLANLRERLGGALALVSGRAIADVDRLFAPLRLPVAGAHGAERRAASGRVQRCDERPALAPAKRLLAAWAAAHAGVILEDKGAALALHYRLAPELESAARRTAAAALAAAGPRFQLQHGKKVLEIRAASVGKGRAIAAFMSEPPFAGRLPVFLGDDLTDEDGFEAVNRLGGHSIGVGVHRVTHARWRLADEASASAWLESNVTENER